MPTKEEKELLLQQRWLADRKPMTEEELAEAYRNSRLSLPAALRIPLATGMSFILGWSLGTAQGSKMAGLRFRAEHAHKLPDSTTGWYMYHRSKNYHVATAGLVEGMKMGMRVSFWTTTMLGIEHMFDTYRGTADVLNTLTSCVTVAGGFSLWSKETFHDFGCYHADIVSPQIDSPCRWQPEQPKLPWSLDCSTEGCKMSSGQ
jgi:hypothetical protein